LADFSVDAPPLSPAEFGKLMVQDIEKSGAAVEPPTLRPILAYLPSMFRRFWLSETALCRSWVFN
jgi:hypothetical protein